MDIKIQKTTLEKPQSPKNLILPKVWKNPTKIKKIYKKLKTTILRKFIKRKFFVNLKSYIQKDCSTMLLNTN